MFRINPGCSSLFSLCEFPSRFVNTNKYQGTELNPASKGLAQLRKQ